jgi:serine/threonine protein kinase
MDKGNELHPHTSTPEYQVEKVIGKGTFGVVYLVRDEEIVR